MTMKTLVLVCMDIITCSISVLFELSLVLQVIEILSCVVVKASHSFAHVI